MIVDSAVAFAGGVLSLLSPCSAMLLPSFFAYAYPSPGRLVRRTAIFYAGLVTLFIPLGVGAAALGSLIRDNLGAVTAVAGGMLIAIGVVQFAVGGFEVPGSARLAGSITGESAAATYALGVVYGIGGFCTGPILGGILTVAAVSGGAVRGGALLAIFAAGMALPLLALAAAWDRIGTRGRGTLRGREWRIGPVRRHSTVVVSSAMFVVLGAIFIRFRGGNALSGIYKRIGAEDAAFRAEGAVRDLATSAPWLVGAVALALAFAAAAFVRRSRRRTRERVASP